MRGILTFLFCLMLGSSFAQQGSFPPQDTDVMRLAASKATTRLDRMVKLSPEQRTGTTEVYMFFERTMAAWNYRYDSNNVAKEQKDADFARMRPSLDQEVDSRITALLTPEQLAKWKAASTRK